jgi:hypothetical protein
MLKILRWAAGWVLLGKNGGGLTWWFWRAVRFVEVVKTDQIRCLGVWSAFGAYEHVRLCSVSQWRCEA